MSIFYPYCRECHCLLNIKFNDSLNIDFECEKDENHKGKKIYFQTFKRFYLKKEIIETCSNCGTNLLNENIFRCKECDKLFCSDCSSKSEHIKNGDPNFEIKDKKCYIHKEKMNYYCINCREYFCIFCIKEDKRGYHKKHKVENLDNIMPSLIEIDDLKERIKQKSKCYSQLIDKINLWKNSIITKTEQLIQNLKEEIIILKQILFNFDIKFVNYSYYKNFEHLKNYIKDINNKYLINFYNETLDFKNQSYNLIEFFSSNYQVTKRETKNIKSNPKMYYLRKNSIIEKINDKYYFDSSINGILFYDKNKDKFFYEKKLDNFEENIYSISLSFDEIHLYACLKDKKIVKIFNLGNLLFMDISINNKEIVEDIFGNFHFNKCIQITDNYLTTADDFNIKIWENNNYKDKIEIIKIIGINSKISDLLYVNYKYFISSQPKIHTINVININSLEIEKTIFNIDCIDSPTSLFILEDYIIINCEKGIKLMNENTIEIIQFIPYICDDNIINKKLYTYNEKLYILEIKEKKLRNLFSMSLKIKLNIYRFFDGLLEKIKEYEPDEINEEDLNMIVMEGGDIFLSGKNMYILK